MQVVELLACFSQVTELLLAVVAGVDFYAPVDEFHGGVAFHGGSATIPASLIVLVSVCLACCHGVSFLLRRCSSCRYLWCVFL